MVSQLKVNEIIKQSGSSITIGEAGDTITFPSSGTASGIFTMVPAFQANTTTDATVNISNQSLTKVTFATEVFDTDSKFSDSRFTPTIAGKYYVFTRLSFNTATDFDDLRLHFYKNGSRYSGAVGRSEYYQQIYLYDIIDFDADDYVEVYAYQDSGGTVSILTNEDGRRNCFGAYKVIGA